LGWEPPLGFRPSLNPYRQFIDELLDSFEQLHFELGQTMRIGHVIGLFY